MRTYPAPAHESIARSPHVPTSSSATAAPLDQSDMATALLRGLPPVRWMAQEKPRGPDRSKGLGRSPACFRAGLSGQVRPLFDHANRGRPGSPDRAFAYTPANWCLAASASSLSLKSVCASTPSALTFDQLHRRSASCPSTWYRMFSSLAQMVGPFVHTPAPASRQDRVHRPLLLSSDARLTSILSAQSSTMTELST